MGNFSVNRSPSLPSLTGPPQPQRVRSETTLPVIETPSAPVRIGHEAEQMVKKAGSTSTEPTIATSTEIAQVRDVIDRAAHAVDTSVPENKLVDKVMQRSCTPENLRIAISLLGKDHPKVAELLAELDQAGSDKPSLKALRAKIVEVLRSHVQGEIKQEKADLKTQIAIERSPEDKRGLLRRILFSGNYRADTATHQQSRFNAQSQAHLDEAGKLNKLANKLMDGPPTATRLANAIEKLGDTPEAAAFKARLEAPNQNPATLKALRNELVNALRVQAQQIESLGQDEHLAGARLESHKGQGAEELIGHVSLVASLVSSSNTAMKMAVNSEGFMGVAGSTVGIVFGGLHLVTEAIALRRNVIRLNDGISRQEGARLVLLSPSERQDTIRQLEAQIASQSKPSWLKTQAGRAANVEKLQAKVNALKAMGTTESSPEAVAIAKQVMAAAAVTHKALRVAKNIAGLAAGAIAIAVAAGALATPIGWAAAGVVVTATVSLVLYNRFKNFGKDTKINALVSNRELAASAIIDLRRIPDSMEPGTPEHRSLKRLEEQHTKTMIQLLTISPRHAATAIIAGLKATPPDEQMRTLATQALHVPPGMTRAPFSPNQEAELTEYLMRGIPIQPKL